MSLQRWVALAEVARPHGIKGELRLHVYNLDSDRLLARPELRLVLPNGETRSVRLRAARRVPGAILVRIDGIVDRDAAEALRGAKVEVAREDLGEAEEGAYFACDLEGCTVTLDGARLGTVSSVARYPTCDALVIERPTGGRLEVPINDDYVGAVSLAERTIALRRLPGLE